MLDQTLQVQPTASLKVGKYDYREFLFGQQDEVTGEAGLHASVRNGFSIAGKTRGGANRSRVIGGAFRPQPSIFIMCALPCALMATNCRNCSGFS